MEWRKLAQEEIDAFYAALPTDPRVLRVKMFGLPHGKVGDYMFAGRHGSGITVRPSEKDRSELLRDGGRIFEPMPGRPMKDWVLLPETTASDPRTLARIIHRAFEYTASLPPKAKKVGRGKRSASTKAKKAGASTAAARGRPSKRRH